jgi:hypothetical protein
MADAGPAYSKTKLKWQVGLFALALACFAISAVLTLREKHTAGDLAIRIVPVAAMAVALAISLMRLMKGPQQ